MADTALSALTATTALASGDLFYVVDGGASRKIDYDNVVSQIAAATKTLTNTTFDANGTGNSLSNVETADIASSSKSGADATLVTGTAGTSGNLASWNVDGDLVDSGSAPSAFATAAQGALADSATQPGDDASTLGSGAATDGYVLTADGLGGAAWEAASGGGGTPGGSDTQVQFNDGGAFGGDSGMTFDKTAKTLTLGGGTLTASSPVLDMAQTWINIATTFTGIKYNVTDAASASGSLLMDLQVGGTSKFSVAKGAGVVFAPNLVEQRNSTNAQTFNLYNTYTDASNYERGFMKWNSNEFRIGAESGGTGTNRPVILEATRVVLARAGLVAGDVSFVPRRSNAFDIAQAGGGAPLYQFEAGWLKARYTYQYAWVPSNDANVAADTGLARSAAGVVKVTNGSTGTGELIFIVPTTDPGITGALWNNAGTLSISA